MARGFDTARKKTRVDDGSGTIDQTDLVVIDCVFPDGVFADGVFAAGVFPDGVSADAAFPNGLDTVLGDLRARQDGSPTADLQAIEAQLLTGAPLENALESARRKLEH